MLSAVFANRSIRFKLLFYFVVITLFSIMAFSLLGSTLYRNAIEEETNAHTVQMMNQVKDHIDVYNQEMSNIIYYLAQNDSVLQFMQGKVTGIDELKEQESNVRHVQQVYRNKHKEIAGALIVSSANQFIASGLEPITRESDD